MQQQTHETDLNEILQVRRDKLKDLQESGRDPFREVKFDRTHTTIEVKDNYSALEGNKVTVAGRLMSKRGMGKVMFCDLQDIDGRIQLFVKMDLLGEEYDAFKKLDIGDILGATGEVFTTKTGEISVKVESYTLLSKSLQPLPEKFHGLTDTDIRYRQRYVDLIMNTEVKDTFIKRSKIIASIRNYLNGQGFL